MLRVPPLLAEDWPNAVASCSPGDVSRWAQVQFFIVLTGVPTTTNPAYYSTVVIIIVRVELAYNTIRLFAPYS